MGGERPTERQLHGMRSGGLCGERPLDVEELLYWARSEGRELIAWSNEESNERSHHGQPDRGRLEALNAGHYTL